MKCAIKIKAPFHSSCGFDEISSKLTRVPGPVYEESQQREVD